MGLLQGLRQRWRDTHTDTARIRGAQRADSTAERAVDAEQAMEASRAVFSE